MNKKFFKRLITYFNGAELLLWCSSLLLITVSFLIFDRTGYLSLAASLIGATALILNAKGNPTGQVLVIIFSALYGYISWECAYYGEMITYVGMTAPMAILALVDWLRHPFKGNHAEVAVARVGKRELLFMALLTVIVTVIFYFILEYFNTANLFVSTLSVTTSFAAVYLTFRRSPYFALAYAANDVVLIVLWSAATINDLCYVSVLVCFITFLFNDIYGLISWRRMERRQLCGEESADSPKIQK